MKQKFIFSIFLLFLFSCEKEKPTLTAEYYFQEAIGNIKSGNILSAKTNLNMIESDFPYSKYSDKAEILNGFVSYISAEYDEAINIAEKFIKLRPANPNVDYMYFLRARAYFMNKGDYLREQDTAKNAKDSYIQLISRFAEKKYTDNALESIKFLNNDIAHYNLNIGRTHLENNEYIPAIERFTRVIAEYQNSKYVPESHYRLVEAYLAMGLIKQAQFESQRLNKKFPQNIWNKRNFDLLKNK